MLGRVSDQRPVETHRAERTVLRAFLGYRKANAKLVHAIIEHINRTSTTIKTEPSDQDSLVRLICDFHLQGGDEWARSIRTSIDQCDLMFVLVTSELVGDDSSYLTTVEIPRAEKAGIPVVPIVYEGVLSQLELHAVARRHAIPDGGQPPSRLGGEARWMERLISSIDKRCLSLLKQRRFTESDALVATLSKVHALAERCEHLFALVVGQQLSLSYASARRVLEIVKRIVNAPSHSLIAALRAASDQLKLLRISYVDRSDLAAALGQLQLAVDDAWSHAVLADYPTPVPVADDGTDPIVPRNSIGPVGPELRGRMDGTNAAVQRVRQVGAAVNSLVLRALTNHGCEQVDIHNELAGYMLEQAYVDTGLVTHIARGAFDESIILNRSVGARQFNEAELQAAAVKLTEAAALVFSLARQMAIEAKRLAAPTGEETLLRSENIAQPIDVEFNSNEVLSKEFKRGLAERISAQLYRIGLSTDQARIKLVIRRAKGRKFRVVLEFRYRGLGTIQSSIERYDLDEAIDAALGAATSRINRKRERTRGAWRASVARRGTRE